MLESIKLFLLKALFVIWILGMFIGINPLQGA